MLMIKNLEVTEKELVLADYVSIHEPGLKTSQIDTAKPGEMQVNREELFKRIQRQRGEVLQSAVQRVEKPAGDLIDVRLHVAVADKKGCVHFSEVINEDDKVVA